jgi:hypothetical protein
MDAGGPVFFDAAGAWRSEDWQCFGSGCLTDLHLQDLTAPISPAHLSAVFRIQSLVNLGVVEG